MVVNRRCKGKRKILTTAHEQDSVRDYPQRWCVGATGQAPVHRLWIDVRGFPPVIRWQRCVVHPDVEAGWPVMGDRRSAFAFGTALPDRQRVEASNPLTPTLHIEQPPSAGGSVLPARRAAR